MTAAKTENAPYREAVGRRKTSHARVRVRFAQLKKDKVTINEKPLASYFPLAELQQTVTKPLERLGISGIQVQAQVAGGGIRGQAEAIRHGLARALTADDASRKPLLKSLGLLTRDARAKERRKFGLKKARRAPQWSKR